VLGRIQIRYIRRACQGRSVRIPECAIKGMLVATDGRRLIQPLKLVKVPIEDVELKASDSSSGQPLLPVAAPPLMEAEARRCFVQYCETNCENRHWTGAATQDAGDQV
jgi:hypothetical protein